MARVELQPEIPIAYTPEQNRLPIDGCMKSALPCYWCCTLDARKERK